MTRSITIVFSQNFAQPEAEFMDEIQTKALSAFLLVILSHLYSFALRFLFLQTISKEENLIKKPYLLPHGLRNPYWTSSLRTIKIMPRNLNETVTACMASRYEHDYDRRETATLRHMYFCFVSKYSVGRALCSGNKMAMAGCPPPIFRRPDKCPSSKWCHERNSVRYPEIMLIEENPGSILLFFLRHYHPRLYSKRTWS